MTDLDQLRSDAFQNDNIGPAWDAMWTAIRSYALRQTRDEDAASEVCAVVFRKLPSFIPQGPDSFRRWIRAIVRRHRMKVIDRTIAQRRRVDTDVDSLLINPSRDGLFDTLRLADLEPWRREVAEQLLAGFTLRQIADSMNIDLYALHGRLYRARVKDRDVSRINV